MTMITTMCLIIALLAAAFLAVRLFNKSETTDEPEVMRLSRKDRASAPPPE